MADISAYIIQIVDGFYSERMAPKQKKKRPRAVSYEALMAYFEASETSGGDSVLNMSTMSTDQKKLLESHLWELDPLSTEVCQRNCERHAKEQADNFRVPYTALKDTPQQPSVSYEALMAYVEASETSGGDSVLNLSTMSTHQKKLLESHLWELDPLSTEVCQQNCERHAKEHATKRQRAN